MSPFFVRITFWKKLLMQEVVCIYSVSIHSVMLELHHLEYASNYGLVIFLLSHYISLHEDLLWKTFNAFMLFFRGQSSSFGN